MQLVIPPEREKSTRGGSREAHTVHEASITHWPPPRHLEKGRGYHTESAPGPWSQDSTAPIRPVVSPLLHCLACPILPVFKTGICGESVLAQSACMSAVLRLGSE